MNQTPRGQRPMQRQVKPPSGLPRQAPNSKWYPSRSHPNYVAPSAPPTGGDVAAPGQGPGAPADPSSQTWTSPLPAVHGFPAVQVYAANLSATTGVLFGGLVIAAIAMFMPWVTVSVDSPLGGSVFKVDASPFTGAGVFAVLLVIAGAMWLAWPILSGSPLPLKRLYGLTVAVAAQIICLFIGFGDYANGVGEKSKVVAGLGQELTGLHVSIEFGLLLYAAAVVAITVGLVRIWMQRSHAAKRTS